MNISKYVHARMVKKGNGGGGLNSFDKDNMPRIIYICLPICVCVCVRPLSQPSFSPCAALSSGSGIFISCQRRRFNICLSSVYELENLTNNSFDGIHFIRRRDNIFN